MKYITWMHWFGRICSVSRPRVWGKLLTCWHWHFTSSELSTQPEWPKCRKAKAKSTPCFRTWFLSHWSLVFSRALISCPLFLHHLVFWFPLQAPASLQCVDVCFFTISMICSDLWSVCPYLSTSINSGSQAVSNLRWRVIPPRASVTGWEMAAQKSSQTGVFNPCIL